MGEARVVVNLKEGVIEVQGPVDFVRHCLEMYEPTIKGLQGSQDVAVRMGKVSTARRNKETAAVARPRRRRRVTVMGAVRSDLEGGFFDEPRSTGEVKRRLTDEGLAFTDSGVRANLRRLTLAGLLDTVRKGRSVRFQRRSRS